MRKYIILFLFLIATPGWAAQQEITVVPDSPVLPSIGALKDALNLRLTATESNFDELYAAVAAGALVIQTTAPADTTKVWIDTDQDNAIKVYITDTWTVVGSAGSDTLSALSCDSGEVAKWNGEAWACAADATAEAGSGDDLGAATYSDVVGLWTTCSGYLKSDGTCDTPSGSFSYPGAGVPLSTGSAWGTSYTVGTAANNLVQLNASAQLPAVSGALLTNIPLPTAAEVAVTDTANHFTGTNIETVTAEIGAELDAMPNLAAGTGITITEDGGGAGIDTIGVTAGTYQAADADLDDLADGTLTGSKVSAASDTAAGVAELAIASEVNTGTDAARAVTPDALSGSNLGSKEIGWVIVKSDTGTAVADGKQAIAVPSSINGMNLIDVTCSVSDLNSAASGETTVVLRRVRGATAVDMTSTGVTIGYNEYTASDETVDTANDDVQTGDKIFADVNAVTTAAHKGLYCTAVFRLP